MPSIETATGSFSEHLACKRRSSGANYVRRREAAEQPLADATLQIPPLVPSFMKP